MQGVVEKFFADRGYGFIKSDDGGQVFVHIKDARKGGVVELSEGQRLEFLIAKDPKTGKLRAVDVRAP
ncbi:MAG TPA: cold shock domain-containing protein [Stellaceae bacterium]|nr:cold shock domain-containing protein [Stellaceae bacterium]